MNSEKSIVNFEDAPVRRVWDEKEEKWYFSVVDVVGILSQSADPRNYWKVLKNRLNSEGSEVVTKCNQLKMEAEDGKMRETDAADTETLLRLIQSIPSPKAEPFKMWLAKVGYERLQETVNPQMAVDRARGQWKSMGRDGNWIRQRMLGIEIRNKLTDYWSESGIKQGQEYASLTDIIHQEWSGLTTGQHKKLKNLKQHNLRDNMTDAEIIFTSLAELSTTQIAQSEQAKGFIPNAIAAQKADAFPATPAAPWKSKPEKKSSAGRIFYRRGKLRN